MASAALKASDDYSDLVPNPNHKHSAAPEQNEDPEIIQFYESVGQYGCFSNFSRHAISIDNKRWPTTEHYFQAQKFSGTYHEEEIRSLDTPMAAAQAGRDRSRPLRRDWEDVKDDIMYKALMAKFTQHVDCARTLLRTGDATLVEHTKNDSYWADGGNGKGKNMLGVLLMRVRKELQEHPEVKQVAAEVAAEFAADEAEDDLADVGGRTHNKIKTKKKKLRARVNIYVDKDGSSKLESANDGKGTVNVVSSGGVSLNKKALPAAAQMAVLRNQFTRRYQNNDEDADDNGADEDEEEEVDSEYIMKRNNKQGNNKGGNNLSNYLPGGAKAAPAPVADNSVSAIMADVRNKVDLITDCMNAKAARAQFSQIVTELYAKREELAALAASEQSDERVATILALLDSVDAVTERMNAYAEQ